MTRLSDEPQDLRSRNIIDLRPLALSRWENEGGAVPDRAPDLHQSTHTPPRRRVLPASAQITGAA
jgi:hypothetical protein